MPHRSRSKSKSRQQRRPLEEDLVATGNLKAKSNKRKSKPDEDTETFIESSLSNKILKIGQELVEEEEQENGPIPRNSAFEIESRQLEDPENGDEDRHDAEDAWGDGDELLEEVELQPQEMDTFHKFMPLTADALMEANGEREEDEGQGTNLADLILEKIAAHEAATGDHMQAYDEDEHEGMSEIPPKVVEVYTK